MPREKKDLPLEANLFWFDEGMWPERLIYSNLGKR
jgi:hypothetical protein